jgi:hypothetical protein
MIWVSYHFSDVASQLSRQGIEVTQTQRKYSIQPKLEVLSGINYTNDFDEIVVPVRNFGTGLAIAVRAVVAYEGKIRELRHQFLSVSGELDASTKVLRNEPGTQQRMFTLGDVKGKDWIASGETVQFRFSAWTGVDRPEHNYQISADREFTIFLSFLDVDQNEYLTIEKSPIGGKSALFVLAGTQSALNDSLLRLSNNVKPFNPKTYDYIRLRSETGWFIDLGDSLTHRDTTASTGVTDSQ